MAGFYDDLDNWRLSVPNEEIEMATKTWLIIPDDAKADIETEAARRGVLVPAMVMAVLRAGREAARDPEIRAAIIESAAEYHGRTSS